MERASLPSPTAAAIDEALMDSPLSPKRPRQADPPSQVCTGATTLHPRITTNSAQEAAMLTAMLQHKPHN